jgi:hypothetical protein
VARPSVGGAKGDGCGGAEWYERLRGTRSKRSRTSEQKFADKRHVSYCDYQNIVYSLSGALAIYHCIH